MKNRGRTKTIIILSIICILLVVIAILYFKTDFFRTKRSAFLRYFDKIPTSLNILETNENEEYFNKKKTSPYIRKGTATIQTSSNVADSSILDKLKLNLVEKTDNKSEKANINITIESGSTQLETISAVREKDKYAFYCEDIANGYIGVKNDNLKRIVESAEFPELSFLPNKISLFDFDKILETTKVEKNHINECVNLVKNNVPSTAYSKESGKKIKIEDKTYSTTVYKLNLDSHDFAKLEVDILKKASQDSILMDYMASKFKLLNFEDEYTNINSLNNLMKKKIEELTKNPELAGSLTVTIYENKQRNIRTEIENNDNKIVIDHLEEDKSEMASVKINSKMLKLIKDEEKTTYIYEEDGESKKQIQVEFSQTGTLEDNDIKNQLIIKTTFGAKSITYLYKDSVEFTNDIGKIETFGDEKTAILNDYTNEEISNFIKLLKAKINQVYISKGATIGINLDPIFEIEVF